MTRTTLVCLSLLVVSRVATSQDSEIKAAARFVPGVTWHADSVIRADFTCRGRKQTAILGDSPRDVIVAVFLSGLNHRPEVLRFTFPRGSTRLEAEGLDDDPKYFDYPRPGFQRSKICKGFSLEMGKLILHISTGIMKPLDLTTGVIELGRQVAEVSA